MGRSRKEIDKGVMLHMLKNKAPLTVVAKQLGIHRDTLYKNYAELIEEGREANRQAWKEITTPVIEEWLRKRREKQEAKKGKRKYRPRGLHPSYWEG